VPELQSAEGWVKCSNYFFKIKVAHSLWMGMISIIMIHSLMAGAVMDRSEQGETSSKHCQQKNNYHFRRKISTTSEDLKVQTC
jgi:hypothetical protein